MRTLALMIVAFLVMTASGAAQPGSGVGVLVGEWVGTWKSATGSVGYLALWVEAVDGEQVRGTLYMAVTAPDTQGYYNRDVRFTGAFDGTTLRVTVPPALFFSMTAGGQSLRGTVQGQQTFGAVDLVRKRNN